MKKIIIITLFWFGMLITSNQLFAQGPPPPPDGHGSNDNEAPGGGAPISGELVVLFGFALAYGGKKAYQFLYSSVE